MCGNREKIYGWRKKHMKNIREIRDGGERAKVCVVVERKNIWLGKVACEERERRRVLDKRENIKSVR